MSRVASGLLRSATMPITIARAAGLSLVTFALVGAAAAEEAPLPPAAPVAFTTLGADGLESHVTVQLGLQDLEGDGASTIKRFDLGGQFMGNGNAGAYGSIAFATIEDDSSFTALEAGGVYRVRGATTDTALRAGLVLPTLRMADDASLGDLLLPSYSTALSRPSDLVTAAHETTTLRLAAAPSYRSGQLVLRADVGLDIPVDAPGSTPDPIYHVDLGAALQTPRVAVTAELENVGSTDSDAEGMLHVLALGVQARRGRIMPFATVSLPFSTGSDSEDLGNYNAFLGARFGI